MDYQDKYKKVLLASPHCNLGKKGITDEFIGHVLKLLKRYKIIKIRALKTVASKSNIKQLAKDISELTESYVLDVRGKIIILGKNKI
ncbi:MAG: YhbY family RNA-binding protein [Candidatus Lokiarchaeota archaeon]|nr:YhbY family RNA-binding protein [Candidatus Lokiarchaeota archaeon]